MPCGISKCSASLVTNTTTNIVPRSQSFDAAVKWLAGIIRIWGINRKLMMIVIIIASILPSHTPEHSEIIVLTDASLVSDLVCGRMRQDC